MRPPPFATPTGGIQPVAKKRRRHTAKTADRHALYELSVQAPENEVHFLNRVYKKAYGRKPLSLREDFCGTALLCAEWVRSHKERTAVGIDLDGEVLAWGRRHNIEPLGKDALRVRLNEANVLDVRRPKADVLVAFNFSYWVFKRRADLVRYFKTARASLGDEGLFVLDILGGPDAQCSLEESKPMEGFTYVWEQASFNPIDHDLVCHIHFEFPDGTRMRRAFTYEWRLWSLAEVKDCLAEAGFSGVDVYWEGTDWDTMEGNGAFTRREKVDNEEAWVSYVVARP
jgi:hypothetical protein